MWGVNMYYGHVLHLSVSIVDVWMYGKGFRVNYVVGGSEKPVSTSLSELYIFFTQARNNNQAGNWSISSNCKSAMFSYIRSGHTGIDKLLEIYNYLYTL